MLIARYWLIVPVLAIAGSLAREEGRARRAPGTLPTHTPLFVGAARRHGACWSARSPSSRRSRSARSSSTCSCSAAIGSITMTQRSPRVRPQASSALRAARSCGARSLDCVPQARPAPDDPQPGHVRGRGGQRLHDAALRPRARHRAAARRPPASSSAVSLWLWFTVLFANFAEAMAEGRGKAQADTLRAGAPGRRREAARASRGATRRYDEVAVGRRCARATSCSSRPATLIPGDGEVDRGRRLGDESAITGESAPVIRESGGDRSAVTGGTRVLSDWLVVRDHARTRARRSSIA